MISAPEPVSFRNLRAYARARIEAAAAYSRDRLHHRRLITPALECDVWYSSAALADLYESRLVSRKEVSSGPRRRVQIHLLDASLGDWEYPAVWEENAWFATREFDKQLAQDGLRGIYHDAPSWQFFDTAAGTGIHTLPRPDGIAPWEPGSPLRLFLHWAHATAGIRLTHAATLASNGNGALIVGSSGSGKSGTTLAGLLHGLTSAGDDYVLLDLGEAITAHAIYRVFKQDAEGLRRAGLTPAAVGAGEPNWHGKYEFDAARLAPQAFVERMTVRAVLIPQVAHAARTRFEPVPAARAAMALAPSAVFQLSGDMDGGFRFLAEVARRLPAFRVLLSENPAEIADAIGTFLESEACRAR